MNTIESDFLKITNKHIKVVGDEIIVNHVSLAEELAGKTERFIEWLQFDDYLFIDTEIKGRWMKVDKNDSEYYSLYDLWEFWLKEIDTKK